MAACQPDAPGAVEAGNGSSTSSIFSASAAVTADFAPPHCPHPRPWQRVPVPTALATSYSLRGGLRKIWKRVGGIPQSTDDRRYAIAISELRADGSGPRKRQRAEQYVAVWGNTLWKEAGAVQTGKLDWELAKDSVDAYYRASVTSCFTSQRRSKTALTKDLFCDDALQFVPRKRDSRRVLLPRSSPSDSVETPVAPDTTPDISAKPTESSLTKDESLDASPAQQVDQPILFGADAEHITKRVKRRIGRRFSVSPEQQFYAHSTEATKTPSGKPAVNKARKSLPARWFPTPLERHVSAAATVPFTPPLENDSSEEHPDRDNPLSVTSALSDSTASTPPPVVIFNQPAPEVGDTGLEAYLVDAKRHMSMQNARHRDTWNFAGILDDRRCSVLLEYESDGNAALLSRRRSMVPFFPASDMAKTAPQTTKLPKAARRQTLHPSTTFDFQFVSQSPSAGKDGEASPSGPIPTLDCACGDTAAAASNPATSNVTTVRSIPAIGVSPDSTVVVDVRTNLDIFGSGPPVHESHISCPPPAVRGPVFDMPSALEIATIHEKDERPTDPKEPAPDLPASPSIVNDPRPTIVDDDLLDLEDDGHNTPQSDADSTGTPASDVEKVSMLCDETERLDESRLVSDQPGRLELSESLFLRLSEMASTSENETDDILETMAGFLWQSPLSTGSDQDQVQQSSDVSFLNGESEDSEYDAPTTRMELDVATGRNEDEDEEFPAENAGILSSSPSSREADTCETDDNRVTDMAAEEAKFQAVYMDGDATMTMVVDINNLTDEQQYAAHDDSETEMLRKFVTRVRADKSAKAAAAAAAAAVTSPPTAATANGSLSVSSTTAALARSRLHLRQKRRSGSTGSAASASGSPLSKSDAAQTSLPSSVSPLDTLQNNRVPLGTKDHNMSPSPVKRKSKGISGTSSRGNGSTIRGGSEDILSKPSLDDTLPPRPKRRRKKMEADTGGIFNPEFSSAAMPSASHGEASSSGRAGLRRSKRTRAQTPLKFATSAAAASSASGAANNSALSLIPIRLPGSLNLSGEDGGVITLSAQRNGMSEKDLAAVTRVNTRKNKGKADPPCVLLARQAEESTSLVNLEKLSSVFDSPGNKASTPSARGKGIGKQSRKVVPSKAAKTVRWAEVLVRFQGSDSGTAVDPQPVVSALKAKLDTAVSLGIVASADPASFGSSTVPDSLVGADLDANKDGRSNNDASEDTPAGPAGTRQVDGNAAEADTTAKGEKKAIPRRTARVSRLPPPTPRKALAAAAAAKMSSADAQSSTKPSVSFLAPPVTSTRGPRMTTRRTNILSMGVSGNGTPAPKRRVTRA